MFFFVVVVVVASSSLSHHSSIFNSQSLYELKHLVHLSKTECRIFHFWFRLIFLKTLNFCPTKTMDSFTFKRHNSFQNKNCRKSTRRFATRPMIFRLQQYISKFSDICMSWSSPKTDLEMNLVNLENWRFECFTFYP